MDFEVFERMELQNKSKTSKQVSVSEAAKDQREEKWRKFTARAEEESGV